MLIFLPVMSAVLIIVTIILCDFPLIRQRRRISLDKSRHGGVNIYKIRTIRRCKDFDELEKMSNNIFDNKEYEKYVPSFCRWLRKTGIDEIPQLINVIKGEMSIIGPRPLLEDDLLKIKNCDPVYYFRRTKIKSKPGISGMWQVYGERNKGAANLVRLDELYENKKSFLLDFKIILVSALILFTAAHSDSIVKSSKTREMSVEPDCEPEFPEEITS